jgi:hypothetical protein
MGTGQVGDAEMGWVDASSEGATCGDVEISEMTGAEAGKRGRPPYPGMPSDGNGGTEPDGPLSTAATRRASSPI